MKRSPECRRDYTDETLNFCLDDGSALLEGHSSGWNDVFANAGSTWFFSVSNPRTTTYDRIRDLTTWSGALVSYRDA